MTTEEPIGGYSKRSTYGRDGIGPAPEVKEPWRYRCPVCDSVVVRRIKKNNDKWKCLKCRAKFDTPIDGNAESSFLYSRKKRSVDGRTE